MFWKIGDSDGQGFYKSLYIYKLWAEWEDKIKYKSEEFEWIAYL